MIRKCLAIGIILLFIGTCIIPAIAQDTEKTLPSSRGIWLYVGGSGPGNYTMIQDAINASSDGDIVYVFAGLYIELVTINHSIRLVGEDKNTTIVDGNDIPHLTNTITILKDNVVVTNFTIQNGHFNGIMISSSNNTIFNNIITRNGGGIYFSGGYPPQLKDNLIRDNQIINNGGCINTGLSIRTTISHNIFKNSHVGIDLMENNHILSNNLFENVSRFVVWDSDCSIENNVFISSGKIELYGIRIKIKNNSFIDSQGIIIRSGIAGEDINHWDTHTIENNSFNGKQIYFYKYASGVIVPLDAAEVILVGCTNCTLTNIVFPEGMGVQIAYSSFNTISRNVIKETGALDESGIYLFASSNNNISYNSITDCEYGILLDSKSANNCIYRNIIKNNTIYGIEDRGQSNNWMENHIADNGNGLGLRYASHTTIKKNNFIQNKFGHHISFVLDYKNAKSINLQSNFYSPQIPRPIKFFFGPIQTRFYFTLNNPEPTTYYIFRPGFNIDWHPAQEPYDIPGMR